MNKVIINLMKPFIYFSYFAILGMVFFLTTNCNSRKIDDKQICLDFYNLNRKQTNLNFFKNYIVDARGIEYNANKQQYDILNIIVSEYDSISKVYYKFPVLENKLNKNDFRDGLDDLDEYFVRKYLTKDVFNNPDSAKLFMIRFFNNIIENYLKIKMSVDSPYAHPIIIEGEPYFGLIKFNLTYNTDVYFISDPQIFKEKYLPKDVIKLEELWYYKIKDN